MIIRRWQAELIPTPDQMRDLLESEGLEPSVEEFAAGTECAQHTHPHTEVRVVLKGELMFEVAGNQLLLRPGDRIEVPANTQHRMRTRPDSSCVSMIARRIS